MDNSPFFDYWKNFHIMSERHNLSSHARLIYYRLLEEFNQTRWGSAEIQLTDRDVQRMTNIRSLKSIADSKAELNKAGLMKITNRKNKPTIYELLSPANRNKHEISTEYSRNKHEISTANNTLSLSMSNKTIRHEDGGDRAREETAPAAALCSEEIRREWIKHAGQLPNDGIAEKLGELEKLHGAEIVKKSIETANFKNQGGAINIPFVLSQLNKILYGSKSEKRGDENSGNARPKSKYAGLW